MESVGRALFAVFVLVAACDDTEAEREAALLAAAEVVRVQPDGSILVSDADRKTLGVEIAGVVEGVLPATTVRYGVVRARVADEAMLVAPIAGHVRHLPVAAVGQQVEANTAVFQISPVLATAERVSIRVQGADIQGQITALQRELTFREAEAARARELAGPKIISVAKLQEAETAVDTARARLGALQQARGQQVRGQSGEVGVTAQVGGEVVSIDVAVGAVVHAGDVLGRVIGAGPRWVDVAVEPREVPGDAYEVEVGTAWLPARRLAVGAVVGLDGMRRDRLELDAEALAAGTVVAVRVQHGDPRGILVPASAVVTTPAGDIVYVEADIGTYVRRSIVVAARGEDKVRVTGSLTAGERVVTRGAMGLHGETLRSELRQTE